MMEHVCPNCKREWKDVTDDVDYRDVWCNDCRARISQYLLG